VMEGKPDSAMRMLDAASKVRPRDELVRHLQLGLVYHYAGKWEASNAAFEWAETEAEQRWTRSLTGQVGEIVLNDAAAGYVPPPGEMALIPYYRMLNYLALGTSDGALVEARKASEWLGRLGNGKDPCVGDGFVHYLAGLAFRGAGERNDALVSYRNAERSFGACAEKDEAGAPAWLGAELYRAAMDAGVRTVADSAAVRYRLAHQAARPDAGSAELVVFVENGWVAHRASADVHVPIFPGEVDGVDGTDAGEVAAAAARVLANLVGNLQEQAYWGEALDDRPEFQAAAMADGAYVMKLAWPEYRLEASDAPAVRVVVDSQTVDAPVIEDLSAVMLRRWQRERPAVLARMVGRGIVKFLAAHELERVAEHECELGCDVEIGLGDELVVRGVVGNSALAVEGGVAEVHVGIGGLVVVVSPAVEDVLGVAVHVEEPARARVRVEQPFQVQRFRHAQRYDDRSDAYDWLEVTFRIVGQLFVRIRMRRISRGWYKQQGQHGRGHQPTHDGDGHGSPKITAR